MVGSAPAAEVTLAVRKDLARVREATPVLAGAGANLRSPASSTKAIEEARLLFYLAETGSDLSRDERAEWFKEGRAKAQEIRDREAESPAATFWWAANEGGLAKLQKGLSSISAIARLEKILLQLRDAHPEFGFDAANRMLAAIYIAAPAMISIGSYSKAEAALQLARQRFPEFPGNQIGWIDYLRARGRDTEAVRVAQALATSEALKKNYQEFEYDRPYWNETLAQVLLTAKGAH